MTRHVSTQANACTRSCAARVTCHGTQPLSLTGPSLSNRSLYVHSCRFDHVCCVRGVRAYGQCWACTPLVRGFVNAGKPPHTCVHAFSHSRKRNAIAHDYVHPSTCACACVRARARNTTHMNACVYKRVRTRERACACEHLRPEPIAERFSRRISPKHSLSWGARKLASDGRRTGVGSVIRVLHGPQFIRTVSAVDSAHDTKTLRQLCQWHATIGSRAHRRLGDRRAVTVSECLQCGRFSNRLFEML